MGYPARVIVLTVLVAAAPAFGEDLPTASRKSADAIATVLSSAPERAAVKQVAVTPFTAGPGVPAELSVQAAEAFAARLRGAAKLNVLDGPALRGLLGEQRLQALAGGARADGADPLRGVAQALVTGQLSADGDRLKLQVKLTLLPSGKVLGQAQSMADGPARVALPEPPRGAAPPVESARIEVAMRRVADGLATGFAKLPGNARYRRLAVLPFGEVGERARKQKLGTIVAAELATDLRRDHGLLLAEREKLTQVLSELKLQQMISPDPAAAARVGELADAQALVVGNVAEAGDRYLITARVVSSQTGESLAAESASVPAAGLVALASDAVVLRSRSDAAFRSLIVPGLGQMYNRQPAKAYLFGGTTLALAGTAVAFHVIGAGAESKYKKATTSAEAASHYSDAQSAYRTRNWLLVGTAAAWAVNVVDAYMSGVDGQAALSGSVAAAPVAVPGGGGLMLAGRF